MPVNFTKPFAKAFNVIRLITTTDPKSPLQLFDDENQEIGEITNGWMPEELATEPSGGRIVEVHITDRDDYDFMNVNFFVWGGYRYERVGFPNPPTANPQEWVWQVKPVGVA